MKITLHYFTALIIHQIRKTVNRFSIFSFLLQYFREIIQILVLKMHKTDNRDKSDVHFHRMIRENSSKIRETALHLRIFML